MIKKIEFCRIDEGRRIDNGQGSRFLLFVRYKDMYIPMYFWTDDITIQFEHAGRALLDIESGRRAAAAELWHWHLTTSPRRGCPTSSLYH